MSPSALDKAGKWCVNGEGKKTFYNKELKHGKEHGSVFLVALLGKSDLYIVNPMYLNLPNYRYNYREYDALATKAEAFDLLHKIMGHISWDRLAQMVQSGHIDWKEADKPVYKLRKMSHPCAVCSMAKAKRVPHKGHIKVKSVTSQFRRPMSPYFTFFKKSSFSCFNHLDSI